MKTFDVYESKEGTLEAVKKGWSWPGFFFTWIWCFVKGLGGTGLTILFIIFFDIWIYDSYSVNHSRSGWSPEPPSSPPLAFVIVSYLLPLLVAFWLGFKGNRKRKNKLLEYGYKLKKTVKATNPENAIAFALNKKIDNALNKKNDNSHPKSKTSSTMSDLDQLERLFDMKKKGIITDEEFEKKKKQILNL